MIKNSPAGIYLEKTVCRGGLPFMKGEREEDRNQELSIPPVCYDPQAEGGRLELEYD